MYLVINKWVTAVKVSNFSGHYLRNRSTLSIGVLGYIGIVQHKEHSPEVSHIPPGTPCIYPNLQIFNCASIAFSQRLLFGLSTQGRWGQRVMRQIRGRRWETLKMKRQVGSSGRGWDDINRLYVKEIRQEVWTDYVWCLIGTGGRLLWRR